MYLFIFTLLSPHNNSVTWVLKRKSKFPCIRIAPTRALEVLGPGARRSYATATIVGRKSFHRSRPKWSVADTPPTCFRHVRLTFILRCLDNATNSVCCFSGAGHRRKIVGALYNLSERGGRRIKTLHASFVILTITLDKLRFFFVYVHRFNYSNRRSTVDDLST